MRTDGTRLGNKTLVNRHELAGRTDGQTAGGEMPQPIERTTVYCDSTSLSAAAAAAERDVIGAIFAPGQKQPRPEHCVVFEDAYLQTLPDFTKQILPHNRNVMTQKNVG